MTKRFNDRTQSIATISGNAWLVQDRATAMVEAGEDILFLSIGDPDFETPAAITEAACRALRSGRTHYAPVPGESDLRDAIAHQAQTQSGTQTGRENVTIFTGAQPALFAIMQILAQQGDEILVPEPYYATYPVVALASGAHFKPVACLPEDGFLLQLSALKAAVTPNTRVLLLNSPGNPTGAAFKRKELQAIIEFCQSKDIWVVSDEVYASLCYDEPHISAWEFATHTSNTLENDRLIVVNSLSKSHAMTGWRIGWTLAPVDVAEKLLTLCEGSQFGCPQFVQDAAVVAIAENHPELLIMKQEYRARRDFVVNALNNIPNIKCTTPVGGMFVMADIRQLTSDCAGFAMALLEQQKVATIPGSSFGATAKGHLRITLAQSQVVLSEALSRIAVFSQHFNK
jgi:arginine:pyruvate transaminase